MKLNPYPEYKPSGVEWLGDVPQGWGVRRLKYMATVNDSVLSESTPSDWELRYVDIGSVDYVNGITNKEEMVFENAPSRARRRVQDGDTIVSTVRTYLRAIAPIREPEDNLVVSTGFAVIRPREVNAGFLANYMHSSVFVENVVSRSVGVSYPATNASDVMTIPVPLPGDDEQTAIADFLDRETEKIDRLVAKKRELIAKLKEKRAALITRAVTRGLPAAAAAQAGLNPDAKLKPSLSACLPERVRSQTGGHAQAGPVRENTDGHGQARASDGQALVYPEVESELRMVAEKHPKGYDGDEII